MKVVVTGGGTGGHFFPALSVVEELQISGHDVCYFGNNDFIEAKECRKRNIPFISIASKSTLKKNISFVLKNVQGVLQSIVQLQKQKPDVVYCTGGFTTAPILLAAKILHIPYILHEQNAVVGKVHRMFRKNASDMLHSYPNTVLNQEPIVGNISRFEGKWNTFSDTITFLGGSGGAKKINELAIQYAKDHPHERIILVSGSNYTLEEELPNVKLLQFVEEMDEILSLSQVVISRAGSTTLTELSAFGIPSIIIPMPNSADNHQMKNAKYYEEKDGIILLEQDDSTYERLKDTLSSLDREKKNSLSHNIRSLYQDQALSHIIHHIEGHKKN